MMQYVVLVLAGIGLLFNILAVVGLLRFPDPYTRLHAGTKCTTFGTIFICLAVIVYSLGLGCGGAQGCGEFSIHALVALIAILLTNPTGAHAISRAAHKVKVYPVRAVVDKLRK
jgi:multicomponent Na+:H+ antiporter subunit G